ncbi:MAG: lipoate---protein ligase [Thermococcaceae archaeon]|nr:lipoate---protein ligase [Thermococcaceae archaeon]
MRRIGEHKAKKGELESAIDEFFAVRLDIEMPYINVEDFKIALKNALRGENEN